MIESYSGVAVVNLPPETLQPLRSRLTVINVTTGGRYACRVLTASPNDIRVNLKGLVWINNVYPGYPQVVLEGR